MASNVPNELTFADFWDDTDDEHSLWLENKRDDVAITLTGMLHAKGMSFAELAEKLNWKRSRVSKALSGHENLTINTISEIIKAAGYDFDIALRKPNEVRHFQPWEQDYACSARVDFFTDTLHKEAFRPDIQKFITQAVQAAIEETVDGMAARSARRSDYKLYAVAANDDAATELSEAA